MKPLKSKEDVPEAIISFINMLELHTGNKCKLARSDCARELMFGRLKKYFQTKGIRHGLSPPRTPQSNGFIERAIKSAKYFSRTMRIQANLPIEFWAEMVHTAVYIINRMVNSNSMEKTPFEFIFKKKPNLSHLRIIGCDAYYHVPEQVSINGKGRKGILVGYDDVSNFYRVYDSEQRRLKIVKNVIFDETPVFKPGSFIQIENNQEQDGNVPDDPSYDDGVGDENGTTHKVENERVREEVPNTPRVNLSPNSPRKLRPREEIKKPFWQKHFITSARACVMKSDIIIPKSYSQAKQTPE